MDRMERLGFHVENHFPGDLDVLIVQAAQDLLAGNMVNFAFRIGLNETPLTEALAAGDFEKAEALINEAHDPDYFNDGAHAATPLNLTLSGEASNFGQPRNLKLARMLVERGADPNQRVPNHDLETSFMSPIELLLEFYLTLLKFPRIQGNGESFPYDAGIFVPDVLSTIGLNGEHDLDSEILTRQAKELIILFLEHGADVNLQTTFSGRTIFHVLISADETDMELVERMVTLGALVNLADVHGTTPLMDIVRFPNRGAKTYKDLTKLGKRLILEAQNCAGESAIWRTMFQGNLEFAELLLIEGAASFTMARVQAARTRRYEHASNHRHLRIRSNVITNLPALLAPLLGDSPCSKCPRKTYSKRSKYSAKTLNKVIRTKISPLVDQGWFCTEKVEEWVQELIRLHTQYGHITKEKVFQQIAIIPLMYGEMSCGLRQLCVRKIISTILFDKSPDNVTKILSGLKVGNLHILNMPTPPERIQFPRSRSEPHNCVPPYIGGQLAQSVCDVSSSIPDPKPNLDVSWLSLSEPGIRTADRTSDSETAFSAVTSFDEGNTDGVSDAGMSDSQQRMAIDDNWYLQKDPSYDGAYSGPAQTVDLSEPSVELEISRGEADICDVIESEGPVEIQEPDELKPHSSESEDQEVSQTVTRIHQLLKETDDMIDRLQTEVNAVHLREREVQDHTSPMGDMSPERVMAENLGELNRHIFVPWSTSSSTIRSSLGTNSTTPSIDSSMQDLTNSETTEEKSTLNDSSSHEKSTEQPGVIISVNRYPVENEAHEGPITEANPRASPNYSPSLPCGYLPAGYEDEETSSNDSWDGAFSLRNTLRPSRDNSQSHLKANDESIVLSLSPQTLQLLQEQLGLPPGVMPCFELEVARHQLGLAVHKHQSLECDRGCEGNAFSEDSSSDEDWGDEDNDGSLSDPSFTSENTGVDIDSQYTDSDSFSLEEPSDEELFTPAVPIRPRVLSSSSASSDEAAIIRFRRQSDEAKASESVDESASKEETDEEPTETGAVAAWSDFDQVQEYVQSRVGRNFEHSTDSESEGEATSNPAI